MDSLHQERNTWFISGLSTLCSPVPGLLAYLDISQIPQLWWLQVCHVQISLQRLLAAAYCWASWHLVQEPLKTKNTELFLEKSHYLILSNCMELQYKRSTLPRSKIASTKPGLDSVLHNGFWQASRALGVSGEESIQNNPQTYIPSISPWCQCQHKEGCAKLVGGYQGNSPWTFSTDREHVEVWLSVSSWLRASPLCFTWIVFLKQGPFQDLWKKLLSFFLYRNSNFLPFKVRFFFSVLSSVASLSSSDCSTCCVRHWQYRQESLKNLLLESDSTHYSEAGMNICSALHGLFWLRSLEHAHLTES